MSPPPEPVSSPQTRKSLDEIVDAHRYVDLGHEKGNVIVTISQR